MASSSSPFLLTSKQTLTVLSRSYPSLASSSTPLSKASILRYRPIVAVAAHFNRVSPATYNRSFSTRPDTSSPNDQNPNRSNRPPAEATIWSDGGCDFQHWLVVMDKPEGDMSRDDIIAFYIKTLAEVVGSEEEAIMKIYSVSTRHYFAFGALVYEELSNKLKDIPGVRWVLPDAYVDVENKDYGGEPFINGEAVPYDPKYHEEWMRNKDRMHIRPPNFR